MQRQGLLLPLLLYNAPPPPDIYPLSLHDALPIWPVRGEGRRAVQSGRRRAQGTGRQRGGRSPAGAAGVGRSEEHTSELQSRFELVCRLLLEKKNRHEWFSSMLITSIGIE